MVSALKQIFRSIGYLIHHFDDIPRDLLGETNAILARQLQTTNCLLHDLRLFHLLEKNELFQEHLERLKQRGEAAYPEVSAALEKTAGRLSVYVDRERSRRNAAVCSVALGDDYRRSVQPCLDSHRCYAERAGADHVQLEGRPGHDERPPAWLKIALLYRLLREGYERVLFLDADALVTNHDVSLDRLFAPLAHAPQSILLAEDEGGINTGVILAARRPSTYRLLDLVWTYFLHSPAGNWEQDALKELMLVHRAVCAAVLVAPEARAFNSFPYEREHLFHIVQDNNWRPGDFVCHFSGVRPPLLEKLIRSYVDDYRLEGASAPSAASVPLEPASS